MIKTRTNQLSAGFSLIEVLITIAILAIISTLVSVNYLGYRNRNDLVVTLDEMAAAAQSVRNRSIQQEGGVGWGIRFVSNPNGNDSYEIFKGSAYATSSVIASYPLRRNVRFSEPNNGRTVDITFAPLTGLPSESKVISLVSGSQSVKSVATLTINSRGLVSGYMSDGLIGYWPLDDATSTVAYDASVNNNDGTLVNGPLWQNNNCQVGSCLKFIKTSNTYVDIPINPENGYSISSWIKLDSSESMDIYGDEFSYRGGGLQVKNNYFYSVVSDGSTPYRDSTGFSPQVGSWYHVVQVFNSTTTQTYINGDLKLTQTHPLVKGIITFRLGKTSNGSFFLGYYQGYLDDLRIYNRALTSDEIKTIYESTR